MNYDRYRRSYTFHFTFGRDTVRQPLRRVKFGSAVSAAPVAYLAVFPRPWRRCLGLSRGRPAFVKYSSNRNGHVMTTFFPPARPARGTRGCSCVPQPVQQTGLGVACPLWRVVLAGRSLPSFPPRRGRQRRHPRGAPPNQGPQVRPSGHEGSTPPKESFATRVPQVRSARITKGTQNPRPRGKGVRGGGGKYGG